MLEIIPTTPEHIIEVMLELEKLDKETAYRFGMDSYEVLMKVYRSSLFVKTAVMDGKVTAIWGVIGVYLGLEGRPWSIMSPDSEIYKFKFAKIYRKELLEMQKIFPVLIDLVDPQHTKVLRMLKLMGFSFGETIIMNERSFIVAERRV